MTKGKLIASKVVVGIICALLIIGVIIMSVMLYIMPRIPNIPAELTTRYDNLPNIMGDEGVYISKNFFLENNLEIPKYVFFSRAGGGHVSRKDIMDKDYIGRINGLDYHCASSNLENNNEREYISVGITCKSREIEKLQNKQKHNAHTYGLTTGSTISKDDSQVMISHFIYSVNFNRNENTSKKCQLTMNVRIEHDKDIPSEDYKEFCDNLFYSMLDNVVYRNI
ncbi:MAG: hypothetical protein K2L52_01520 [Clostridia bacterium]|nr:hypothetical protein [Clostridia bacterium]